MAIFQGSCSNKHERLVWLPLHSGSHKPGVKPSTGPSTGNPRNRQETSVCRSNKGGDLFAKHRGRQRRGGRERGGEEEAGVGVWEVLPHLKTPGGPRWWWWTQSVLHRSDACLLFAPLLASRPPPLPASSHPFLTLSFLSST